MFTLALRGVWYGIVASERARCRRFGGEHSMNVFNSHAHAHAHAIMMNALPVNEHISARLRHWNPRIRHWAEDVLTFDRFGTSSRTGSSSSDNCNCDDGGDICACMEGDGDGEKKGNEAGCEHTTPQCAVGTQRTLTMPSAPGGAVETCRCFVMRNAEFS